MTDEGLSAGGTWLELSVQADQEAVEAVSSILSRVAPGGVAVELPFELVDDGLAARPDATRPATVRAHVPGSDTAAADRAVEDARRLLGHLRAFDLRPIGELEVRAVHEEEWAAAWKSHFPVLRVGRRVVIRPTWRRHRVTADDVVLALDPGMAFGTGLHPTTRLCLAGIEAWADAGILNGSRMLDVGCGSGILAICAARFGAATIVAVDTDPVAVEATAANARRNRVAGRIDARQGTVPVGGEPFDLVAANLIASLLVTLAPLLAGSVRIGGRLLAGGIFLDREREVAEAFESVGLQLVGRTADSDWVALETRRAPGAGE